MPLNRNHLQGHQMRKKALCRPPRDPRLSFCRVSVCDAMRQPLCVYVCATGSSRGLGRNLEHWLDYHILPDSPEHSDPRRKRQILEKTVEVGTEWESDRQRKRQMHENSKAERWGDLDRFCSFRKPTRVFFLQNEPVDF